MVTHLASRLRLHEGHLHNLPMAGIPANGLRLVKTGLYLGDLRAAGLTVRSAAQNTGFDRYDARRNKVESRAAERTGRRPEKYRMKNGPIDTDGSFTPSHALTHVLEPADLLHVVSYPMESIETRRYIRGETLLHPDPSSLPPAGTFVGIAADCFLLGFARQMPDGHLKNLYPPAWRKHS